MLSILAQDARPGEHDDSPRPCPLERSRTGIRRGAGRIDVVDEPDCFTRQFAPHAESAAHRRSPTRTRKPAHRSGRALSLEQIGRNGEPRRPAKRLCHRDRLIEATAPKPPPMKWDRHEQTIIVDMAGEHSGHCGGETGASPIFQLKHNATRDIAIGNRRPNAVVSRWRSHTVGAFGDAEARHRQVAQSTPPPRRKFELNPARSAKAMLRDDRCSAPRTARRKREIDEWTKGSRDGQCRTCRLRLAAAQAGR